MKNKNTGISLIETVILIGIISISLISGISLLVISINANVQNKNRFAATYLTQECLELARNVRDSAVRQHLPWDCAFEVDENFNNEFAIKNSAPDFMSETDCKSSLGTKIELANNENTKITWLDGQKSRFQRQMITEKSLENPDEIKITCEISWQTKNKTEKVQISEILTNWQK